MHAATVWNDRGLGQINEQGAVMVLLPGIIRVVRGIRPALLMQLFTLVFEDFESKQTAQSGFQNESMN